MGTGNAPFIRPQSTACLLERGEQQEGEKLARLGAEDPRGLAASMEPCLKAQTAISAPIYPIPPRTLGEGPREALPGRENRVGGGQSH